MVDGDGFVVAGSCGRVVGAEGGRKSGIWWVGDGFAVMC